MMQKWIESGQMPGKAGRYKLKTDVVLSKVWEVSEEIVIDLNGNGITGFAGGCVIRILKGGNLTIKDGRPRKKHYYVNSENGKVVIGISNAKNADRTDWNKFKGGYCFSSNTDIVTADACVQIEGGVFVLKGGIVFAGKSTGGGAVRYMK